MPLTVLNHNITAEQAFGCSSTLVEAAAGGNMVDASVFGAPFQVAALLIGLVYTFFIVRYWDFLRYFIVSTAGFHMPNRDPRCASARTVGCSRLRTLLPASA